MLRFLLRERCGGVLTSGQPADRCLMDRRSRFGAANGPSPGAMAGNARDTSWLRVSRHMETSSFPWTLFGSLPVKLLMEAQPLTIYGTWWGRPGTFHILQNTHIDVFIISKGFLLLLHYHNTQVNRTSNNVNNLVE